MKIIIETDETLHPANTKVTVNGNAYKSFKNLTLKILDNNQGAFTVEHITGYLEAYKSENK